MNSHLTLRGLLSFFEFCTKAKTMSFFSAYIDESGTHGGSPVIIVGGAIADNLNWYKIERTWNAVLKRYGLTKFHAARCNGFYEEFYGWSWEKRTSLYKKLTAIMNDSIKLVVAQGVRTDEYESIAAEFPRIEKTAYEHCLEKCIFAISHWARCRKSCKPIPISIEAGQEHCNELLDVLNCALGDPLMVDKFRIAGISFLPKKDYVPFQIADFVAYELYRYNADQTLGALEYIRPQLLATIMGKRSIGYMDNPKTIREWFDSPTMKDIESSYESSRE